MVSARGTVACCGLLRLDGWVANEVNRRSINPGAASVTLSNETGEVLSSRGLLALPSAMQMAEGLGAGRDAWEENRREQKRGG